MSITTVPYTYRRRNAKSSTPTAVTSPGTGSGSARTNRNSVLRLEGNPSFLARLAPARPASARPIASSMSRASAVRRA